MRRNNALQITGHLETRMQQGFQGSRRFRISRMTTLMKMLINRSATGCRSAVGGSDGAQQGGQNL